MKLTCFDLATTDPAFNLAAEQYVFDCLPRDRAYFMLWQNDNAVIVGKYQNTLAEIDESFVREHGVKVVRRLSGGGAVYHDLGNLNFTFITDAGELAALDLRRFCEPIAEVLGSFGVTAEINGRNDMTVEGKKISGNSQYLRQGRVMHHGTILFDSDLSTVSRALRADESKFTSKAAKSVRSRVANVSEYLPEAVSLAAFRAALLSRFTAREGAELRSFTGADVDNIRRLQRERYDTWEWNYGFSPAYTVRRRARIEGCGSVEAQLSVENGLVTDARFFGDYFCVEEPEGLAARLIGCRADEAGYRAALSGTDASRFIVGLDSEALIRLLCD